MKKSKKLVKLFVIVLVLALCVSTFAACGAKKVTQDKYQETLVSGIDAMFPTNGYYFGIDAAASCTYVVGNETIKYDMVVKGTLDTSPNTDTADNQLQVELKETKSGATKTLLGIYYKDKVDQGAANYNANAPKLFVNINDQFKFAYNTYSIKKLIKDLTPKTTTTAAADTSNMLEIGGEEITPAFIVEALLTFMSVEDTFKTKTVKKETHMTCELNPNNLMTLIAPLITENAEMIDKILGSLDTNLSAELLSTLDLDIPMLLTIRYEKLKKNKTPKLLGGSLEINFDKERPINVTIGGVPIIDTTIPTSKITVSLDKIGIYSDAKVEIDYPAAADYKFINPLNIFLKGELNITNTAVTPNTTTPYDVILAVDANPIPVAYLGGGGWDIKEAVFKSLGKFHFTIISKDGKRAIIDLAYDPAKTGCDSVFATLNLGAFGNISTQLSPSALEGMMTSISKFVNDSSASSFYPKEESGTLTLQSDEKTNWLESLKPEIGKLLSGGIVEMLKSFNVTLPADIQATLDKVKGMVDNIIDDKMVEIGTVARPTQTNVYFKVDITAVANKILNSGIIDIPADTMSLITQLLGVVNAIFGGNVLNLEFTKFEYGGTSSTYDVTANFGANQRTEANFIKSIDSVRDPLISSKLSKPITADEFMKTIDFGKSINMNYTNWKAKTASKSMKVMMVTGFDKDVKGVQSVTIGFMDTEGHKALSAVTSIINGFLPDASKGMMDKIPFGLIRYTFDVTII